MKIIRIAKGKELYTYTHIIYCTLRDECKLNKSRVVKYALISAPPLKFIARTGALPPCPYVYALADWCSEENTSNKLHYLVLTWLLINGLEIFQFV